MTSSSIHVNSGQSIFIGQVRDDVGRCYCWTLSAGNKRDSYTLTQLMVLYSLLIKTVPPKAIFLYHRLHQIIISRHHEGLHPLQTNSYAADLSWHGRGRWRTTAALVSIYARLYDCKRER